MSSYEKLAIAIISGETDADIDFVDMRKFLINLGFEESTRGDHHIFTRDDAPEILNLQPQGSKAKRFQIRQISRMMQRQRKVS